ncbi:hypothetical protein [Uliginosibacterium sp. H1]|uniref:hypothetical protein n=1 Tax=Uliginosibacterium sp. H1 TaxID=3114757 RepID=UPI002E18AEC7|nr:hypothetical protein [Uliginosibacterium sp. H1]
MATTMRKQVINYYAYAAVALGVAFLSSPAYFYALLISLLGSSILTWPMYFLMKMVAGREPARLTIPDWIYLAGGILGAAAGVYLQSIAAMPAHAITAFSVSLSCLLVRCIPEDANAGLTTG